PFCSSLFFLFKAPPRSSTDPLSLHDALPISVRTGWSAVDWAGDRVRVDGSRLRSRPCTAEGGKRMPSNERKDKVRRLTDDAWNRSEEHTSELQSRFDLVCRLLLEKKKKKKIK